MNIMNSVAQFSDPKDNANLCQILQRHAASVPLRPAIIDTVSGASSTATTTTRVASFAQLEEEVTEAATILQAQGVRPLDVVLIYVPLQRELISLLLAVFRLGAQALFIDPAYSPSKVLHCLRLARPKVLVLDKRIEMLGAVAPLFGIDRVITFGRPDNDIEASIKDCLSSKPANSTVASNGAVVHVSQNHPALITFTSGSTGLPKGIVRSHGFLVNQAAMLKQTLPAPTTCEYMQVLTTLPMFILSTLAAGDTAIIPAKDEGSLLNQLKYLAPDRLLCAPHTLGQMSELLSKNSIELNTIKEVVVGGGPVFPELLTKMRDVMPEAILTTVYGSTEAEPICHKSYAPGQTIETSRGLPLGKKIDAIDLQVIDSKLMRDHRGPLNAKQFEALCLPSGAEGEIVVSGQHVIKSYLGNIGDTETKFVVDGQVYHKTGDAGYIDQSGAVYLTGRVSSALKINCRTTYPLTVELVAMQVNSVNRCALVDVRGKAVLALELKEGTDKKDCLKQLADLFSRAEINIDRFVAIKHLPVDQRHQSKIVYSKLRRQLAFTWQSGFG